MEEEELEQLQQLDIITSQAMGEIMELLNSFVLEPKPNGKVTLCLDLARLNLTLI